MQVGAITDNLQLAKRSTHLCVLCANLKDEGGGTTPSFGVLRALHQHLTTQTKTETRHEDTETRVVTEAHGMTETYRETNIFVLVRPCLAFFDPDHIPLSVSEVALLADCPWDCKLLVCPLAKRIVEWEPSHTRPATSDGDMELAVRDEEDAEKKEGTPGEGEKKEGARGGLEKKEGTLGEKEGIERECIYMDEDALELIMKSRGEREVWIHRGWMLCEDKENCLRVLSRHGVNGVMVSLAGDTLEHKLDSAEILVKECDQHGLQCLLQGTGLKTAHLDEVEKRLGSCKNVLGIVQAYPIASPFHGHLLPWKEWETQSQLMQSHTYWYQTVDQAFPL